MAESIVSTIVSSFVNNVGSRIAEEVTFLLGVKEQLRLLHDELAFIKSFLKDAESKRRNSDPVEVWVSKIIELAYDAEDVIEIYVLLEEQQRGRSSVENSFRFGNQVMTLHEFGNRIDEINTRAKRISKCVQKYNLDTSQPVHESSSHRAEHIAWTRRGSPRLEESDIVGFTKEKAQLADWLKDDSRKRKVISVTGMGGLGKTALARVTFNRVSSHFDAKAWVTVSQEYEVRDLLLRVLKEFTGNSSRFKEMDNDELETELHKQLESKRYLVVIDDIWQVEAWERLNRAFPDNDKGSRILLTTRKMKVALHADPLSSTHLELNPLSKDESWELFCKKVFLMPGDPNDLIELGKQIASKCGGIPLAILVMGGLLIARGRTVSASSRLLESATWHLFEDFNPCREILSLSYLDLPYYLKPCFLYLGIFPEDYEIDAHDLVLFWIAEGFIEARGEQKMEDVAEDYLEELVQRSMIQVTKRFYYGGPVKQCRVHDLLHNLSISEGKKNVFMDIQAMGSLTFTQSKTRRIAVHPNISGGNHTRLNITPNLRSYLFFPIGHQMSSHIQSTPRLGAKMLRVLDLHKLVHLTGLPEEIGNLILLHYLRLDCHNVSSLPSSIGKLVNLQTLCFGVSNCIELPKELWKLKNIRHFTAENSKHPFFNPNFDCPDDFVRNLLTLEVGSEIYMWLSGVLVKVGGLRSLRVLGRLSIPIHQSLKTCFPSSLTDLVLGGSRIEQDLSDAFGSLPKLKTFVLKTAAYLGRELVFSREQFTHLQYFHIGGIDNLIDWRVEDGAVPNLRHVCITYCEELKKLPDGLKNVSTLQELEIDTMPASFRVRVEENGEDWEIIKHVPIITFKG